MSLEHWHEKMPNKDLCLIRRKYQAWGPKRLARELGLMIDQVRDVAYSMGLRRRAGRPAHSRDMDKVPLFAWDQLPRPPEKAPTPEEIYTQAAEIRAARVEVDPPDESTQERPVREGKVKVPRS